jgi:hypothetical protein
MIGRVSGVCFHKCTYNRLQYLDMHHRSSHIMEAQNRLLQAVTSSTSTTLSPFTESQYGRKRYGTILSRLALSEEHLAGVQWKEVLSASFLR